MVLLSAGAYILSWPVLYDGLQGVDALWHWHLVSWVSTEFPGLPYWHQWDMSGVPFRNIYPIWAHWLAVAVSRMSGQPLASGIQIVEFCVTPGMAIGLYAFCDWRLRKPLLGLAAGVLFLINPLTWIETVDFSWFGSQLGVLFFMPAVIALDWFCELWQTDRRDWTFRLAAALFIGFTALAGIASPAAAGGPLLVLPVYALATTRKTWLRWLGGPVIRLGLSAVFLQLFWLVPFASFIAFVGQHTPPLVFNPSLIDTFTINKLLEISPIRAEEIADRYSVSLAVTLPALLGLLLMARDAKARVLGALTIPAVALLTVTWLYTPLVWVPFSAFFEESLYRPAALYLRFFAPLLAAFGLIQVPRAIAAYAIDRFRFPRPARLATGGAAVAVGVLLVVIDISAFAGREVDSTNRLALGPGFLTTYGSSGADIRDLWSKHLDPVCQVANPTSAACSSTILTANFSVAQLALACNSGGGLRSDIPICAAIGPDPTKPLWNATDDQLVASTQTWCEAHTDPVCDARFDPLWKQMLDPSLWRKPMVGCYLSGCRAQQAALDQLSHLYPRTPDRLEGQGEVETLISAAHELVGGSQAGSTAALDAPSRALYQFVENSMLRRHNLDAKRELVQITGIDAVALGPNQRGQASDYQALGWTKTADNPLAFESPNPSGLAAEWPSGNAVLVVGASQSNEADVYNAVFERSASGLLVPYARGWLVRGPSAYIDDYTAADLATYKTIVLWGYRYHSRDDAWARLGDWVRAGGNLFVETGWQYVNPDWDGGFIPSLLPVTSTRWAALDPAAPVVVVAGGASMVDPAFGAFRYHNGGWGASSASTSGLRSGAEPLLTVGDRVVMARIQVGSGRVLWSGANLLPHASQFNSSSEDAFIRDQFGWLLPPDSGVAGTTQQSVSQDWAGNQMVSLPLSESTGPTLVLLKESIFPGWSATLVGANGSRTPATILDAEYDYMLVSLNNVPAGARLEFVYRPPWTEVLSWALSAFGLFLLVAWLWFPRLLESPMTRVGLFIRNRSRSLFRGWKADEDGSPA